MGGVWYSFGMGTKKNTAPETNTPVEPKKVEITPETKTEQKRYVAALYEQTMRTALPKESHDALLTMAQRLNAFIDSL